MRERLYRGKLHCTICHREGKPLKCPSWNLVRTEDGSYISYCQEHKPEGIYQSENLSLVETCTHIPWRDIQKVTLHKWDPNASNYKGDIITVEMRNVQNMTLMQLHSIQLCQWLMLIADERNTIHQLGERGEQCHCFVEPSHFWETPIRTKIRDKYWGVEQIKKLHKVCRLMAELHNFEIEDETLDLLTRIVQAIDAEPSSSLGEEGSPLLGPDELHLDGPQLDVEGTPARDS